MKKKVFEYIAAHPHSDVNAIAQGLSLPGLDVLKAIHELERKSYVKLDSPIPLSTFKKNSDYYSATGKQFVESSDEE